MTTLMLDSHNNIIAGDSFLTLQGTEALRQDVRTRLSMFLGEYPFNTTQGINYIGLLQDNNRDNIKNAIIAEIKKDSRVSQVTITKAELDRGALMLDIQITSTQGEVINV